MKRCEHRLQMVQLGPILKDGREPMSVYCCKCSRQWQCESVNFAPMGEAPQWTPNQNGE